MLNNRYIKSIYRDIFVLISFPVFLFQFLFCYILDRKDKKWFKRDIIVLISFLILFVSISFLVNIGKEMSLPRFRWISLSGVQEQFISSVTVNYVWYILNTVGK